MGNVGAGMEDGLREGGMGARSDSKTLPDTGTAAQVIEQARSLPLPLAGGVYKSQNSRPYLRYGNGGGDKRIRRGMAVEHGRRKRHMRS
jgi:hypothetical protein